MVFFKKMTRLVKFAQYAYMDVSALQVPSSAYSGEIKLWTLDQLWMLFHLQLTILPDID